MKPEQWLLSPNPYGTAFGGKILALMDRAAALTIGIRKEYRI